MRDGVAGTGAQKGWLRNGDWNQELRMAAKRPFLRFVTRDYRVEKAEASGSTAVWIADASFCRQNPTTNLRLTATAAMTS